MDKRLRFAEFLVDVACACVIAAVLMVGTAHGQTVGPYGVQVTARQSGAAVPQTPSSNVMNVIIPITVGVAAVGAAAVAIPAVGTAAVAGDVMASVGMTAIRGGIIGGVALATMMNHLGGDVSLDSGGNVVAPQQSANAGDINFNGHSWSCQGATGYASGESACRAGLTALAASNGQTLSSMTCNANGATQVDCDGVLSSGYHVGVSASQGTGCVSGYVANGGACVPDPSAPKQAATDAQIQNAIRAHPASWPDVFNGASCANANLLTTYTGAELSNPCFAMVSSPSTGFGVSFSTGGSSWSNNGCAVNSASCPSATVTTAPTTDTQTRTNADGSKTTTNTTTTRTTTVTGTNDRTNPVEGQTTTTTSTSTTVTNADGSTTTTTTTTTDQAPPQTGTNANQQQKDETQPTTATLVSPDIKLYDKKTKTFGDVLNAFGNTIRASAIGAGVQGFFTVSAAGTCPQWVVPQTDWTPSIALGPIFCSSSASLAYQIAGYAVLAAAAFAAFAIAFL